MAVRVRPEAQKPIKHSCTITTGGTMSLPLWIQNATPKANEPDIISQENNHYIVTKPDGMRIVHEVFPESITDYGNFSIDDSVINYTPQTIFLELENQKSILIAQNTEHSKIATLEKLYSDFLNVAKYYDLSPQDFELAYNFVTLHPAFWHQTTNAPSFEWKTRNEPFGVMPIFESEGHQWVMEHGPKHSNDIRLTVYADTIENAYIKMAQKLSWFYNNDGTDADRAEYELPEFQHLI